jgi:hypothetical protein
LAEVVSSDSGATIRPLLKPATNGTTGQSAEEKYHIFHCPVKGFQSAFIMYLPSNNI